MSGSETLLARFERRPGASPEEIDRAQDALGVSFPPDYVEFMRASNGGQADFGDEGFVILWRVEELADLNDQFEAEEFAPGLTYFGTDGGGIGFAFDGREGRGAGVVSVPFDSVEYEGLEQRGPSFTEFLENMARP